MKNQLKEDLKELEQLRNDLLYKLKVKTAVLKVIEKQIEETKKLLGEMK